MKAVICVVLLLAGCCPGFAQGVLLFANRVEGVVDAPVFYGPANPAAGPGPKYTAQLFRVDPRGGTALTPLVPTTMFQSRGPDAASINDRYVVPVEVTVPTVAPGETATFVMRAWYTAAGSFEAANPLQATQSAPFTITVGGGSLPPASLTGLQPFSFNIPEPAPLRFGVLAIVSWYGVVVFRGLSKRN